MPVLRGSCAGFGRSVAILIQFRGVLHCRLTALSSQSQTARYASSGMIGVDAIPLSSAGAGKPLSRCVVRGQVIKWWHGAFQRRKTRGVRRNHFIGEGAQWLRIMQNGTNMPNGCWGPATTMGESRRPLLHGSSFHASSRGFPNSLPSAASQFFHIAGGES